MHDMSEKENSTHIQKQASNVYYNEGEYTLRTGR